MRIFERARALGLAALICTLLGGTLLATRAASALEPEAEKPAAELFGPTKLWTFRLAFSAEEWAKLEPPQGGGRGGFGGGPPGMRREFPFGRGSVEFDGRTYADVGLRFKGNSTYMMAANSKKKSFKLDFDHYDVQQRFFGLKKINLNNNFTDPAQIREALAYDVFRQADIPAPRTAFAKVYLNVPGKFDQEYLGLYTLVEQVDGKFLQDRLGSSKGLLLKPRIGRVLPYFENWADYKAPYDIKSNEVSDKQSQRLMAFARLVQQADDATFRREIESYLDVDEFLRFIAANGIVGNLDSVLAMGQNYYIYLRPQDDRFIWLPWDLNLAFGGFGMGTSGEQQMDLSLKHPHAGEVKIIERVMAIPEFETLYRQRVREMVADNFTSQRLDRLVDQMTETIAAAAKDDLHIDPTRFQRGTSTATVAEEKPPAAEPPRGRSGFGGPGFNNSPVLKTFVARRVESVQAQLDGKSQGHVPQRGMGPGGFNPGRFLAPQIFKAADANNDEKVDAAEMAALADRWFADWDADKSGAVSADELSAGLTKALGPPPGFPPPQAGDPPAAPPDGGAAPAAAPAAPPRRGPGFGPGMFLGPRIVRLADVDEDEELQQDELSALLARWAKDWDTNHDGALDEKELAAGLDKALQPGPGGPGFFGGPGGPGSGRPSR